MYLARLAETCLLLPQHPTAAAAAATAIVAAAAAALIPLEPHPYLREKTTPIYRAMIVTAGSLGG